MAEASAEQIETAAEVAPEVELAPETEVAPAEAEVDEDREPGGSDGASVYARRKAREAKQLRGELEQERAERIRAEERARVLAEQASRPQPKEAERVLTMEELDALVAKEQITSADRARYIDQVIIPHRIDERLSAREAERAKAQPIERAKAEVAEYLTLVPALKNQASEEFQKVVAEYKELISLGYPANDVTERTAARTVFGSLEALRKRAEVNTLSRQAPRMPVDGSGGRAPSSGKDISNAPADIVDFWNKSGTSQKDREVEWKYYLAEQAKKKR